jgi:hypothetical protein
MKKDKIGFEYGCEEEEIAAQKRHGRIFLIVLVIVVSILWFVSN